MTTSWKARVATLKEESYTLYLACRDPRVPWLPKLVAAVVVAYAFSPIDLIPDFVPVLGYLDDLVLVPLGLALAVRLIPTSILEEHRNRATKLLAEPRPRSWLGAAIVVALWIAALVALAFVSYRVNG